LLVSYTSNDIIQPDLNYKEKEAALLESPTWKHRKEEFAPEPFEEE